MNLSSGLDHASGAGRTGHCACSAVVVVALGVEGLIHQD